MKNIVKMENACGGKGCVTLECLLDEKQLNNKCGLYAHAIIEPGSTLGYHEHHGEATGRKGKQLRLGRLLLLRPQPEAQP